MKTVKYEQTGVHRPMWAGWRLRGGLLLGVSNMRRRKTRTWLTCITLILLTFTVMSFTSVVEAVAPTRFSSQAGALQRRAHPR